MKNIPLSENEIREITDFYSQELEKLQKRANEIRGILLKMEGSKVAAIKTEPIDEIISKKGKGKSPKKVVNKIESSISATVSEPKVASIQKNGKKAVTKVLSAISKKPVIKKVKVSSKKQEKAAVITPDKVKVTSKPVIVPKKVTSKEGKRALKSANAEIKKAKTSKVITSSDLKKGRKKSTDSKKANYEAYILGIISKQGKFINSKTIFDSVEKEFKVPASEYSKMRATVTVILSKEKANGKLKGITQSGTKAKLYGFSEWYDDKGNLKDPSRLK